MCKGERPIGAAKGKQTNAMALCPPPPPITVTVMAESVYGGDIQSISTDH